MNISLRQVHPQDWAFILKIRNQDEVRAACHDTSTISYDAHKQYMKKLEEDPDCHQWIITCDGEDVGHAKIVHDEFGYMIKDGFRGKGIGTAMYQAVFEEAKRLGIRKLLGTIRIDKQAPLKVALKVGFVHKGTIMKDGKPYAYSLERTIE